MRPTDVTPTRESGRDTGASGAPVRLAMREGIGGLSISPTRGSAKRSGMRARARAVWARSRDRPARWPIRPCGSADSGPGVRAIAPADSAPPSSAMTEDRVATSKCARGASTSTSDCVEGPDDASALAVCAAVLLPGVVISDLVSLALVPFAVAPARVALPIADGVTARR